MGEKIVNLSAFGTLFSQIIDYHNELWSVRERNTVLYSVIFTSILFYFNRFSLILIARFSFFLSYFVPFWDFFRVRYCQTLPFLEPLFCPLPFRMVLLRCRNYDR